MATVYAGEHVVLHHRVAIKVLRAEYLRDARMEQRFLNEARAIAAIRHPGIVQLFDIGRAPDGSAYIVMELLDGECLAHRIQAGALPEPMVIAFGRQIAAALAAAHDHSIIHRDLKPDNAFIVADPEVPNGERVKVLDFGVAKRQEATPGPELTGTGVLLGTPDYMSPEQCEGCTLDARSDLYSLGVVLYEMATGQRPFPAVPTGEMVASHLYVRCKPPVDVNPDTSVDLSAIIERCLRKQPRERYQSMRDLGVALAAIDPAAPAVATQPALPSGAPARGRVVIEARLDRRAEQTTGRYLADRAIGDDDASTGQHVITAEQARPTDVFHRRDLDLSPAERSPWPMRGALAAAAAVLLVGSALVWKSTRGTDDAPAPAAAVASETRKTAAPAPAVDTPTAEPIAAKDVEPRRDRAGSESRTERDDRDDGPDSKRAVKRARAERQARSESRRAQERRRPERPAKQPRKLAAGTPGGTPAAAPEPEPAPEPANKEDPFAAVATPTVF
jgi:serine/threonine-protein kinase